MPTLRSKIWLLPIFLNLFGCNQGPRVQHTPRPSLEEESNEGQRRTQEPVHRQFQKQTTQCCTYPLPKSPILSFRSGGRGFGALRESGRKHAAVDLLQNYGSPVKAIADGVVKDFYEFHSGTWAIVIDHEDFVARYGEVQAKSLMVPVGSRVRMGQTIAKVGDVGTGQMLHLELYKGSMKGNLSNSNNLPFKRRGDLLDPSSCVDQLISVMPRQLNSQLACLNEIAR